MEICSRFTSMERKDGAFLLHTDNADIKVCFVTDEIVRVRASFDHELAEESYVLMTTAWEDRMDELFKGERTRVVPFAAELTEDDSTLTFATGKVTLVVDKDPINFKLLAADGSELYSTLPGNPFVKDSNNRVVAYSRMKEDDCFYGFGEKTGLLDKNKTFQRERATDAMGYDAEKMDTLYKHIPFYIRLDRDTHKAVGVFYHNFYESVFNMGCEKEQLLAPLHLFSGRRRRSGLLPDRRRHHCPHRGQLHPADRPSGTAAQACAGLSGLQHVLPRAGKGQR